MLHKETEDAVEGMGDGRALSGRPERSSHWDRAVNVSLSGKTRHRINLGYGQVEEFIMYPLTIEEFG